MQALIDMLAGFIALLIAAVLSQFGVQIEQPERAQPEVRRIADCEQPRQSRFVTARRDDTC